MKKFVLEHSTNLLALAGGVGFAMLIDVLFFK